MRREPLRREPVPLDPGSPLHALETVRGYLGRMRPVVTGADREVVEDRLRQFDAAIRLIENEELGAPWPRKVAQL